ncbi:DUF1523 family protein [Thalassomonas sp. M1454]|uniref:DUF1523 family protein n=1 Tax=Thalassomonas sp. M1454 TaxID=2594477 RepID=UPI0011816CC9|nr:DUF1523 family protein [Thalassomonas sp. M1454]TRX56703.1 DUF1523 family protein [Thalassomonas sp. M1454]
MQASKSRFNLKNSLTLFIADKFKFVYSLLLVLFIVTSTVIFIYAPSYKTVEITGTEAKRSQVDESNAHAYVDTYYIYTTQIDKSFVLRNEDNWVYFKFDSADTQAEAQNVQDSTAVVKYYGFRSNILSIFPNVLSIEKTNTQINGLSWLGYFGLIFNTLLFSYFAFKLIRLKSRLKASVLLPDAEATKQTLEDNS